MKDVWLQVRLLEDRCGNRLLVEQRRLEILDSRGEYHNIVLLEGALTREVFASRRQTACGLRALRRTQVEMRHRAVAIGQRALSAKPRDFVRRVGELWRSARLDVRVPKRRRSWPRGGVSISARFAHQPCRKPEGEAP